MSDDSYTYTVQLIGKEYTCLRKNPTYESYYDVEVKKNEKVEVFGSSLGPLIEKSFYKEANREIGFYKLKDGTGWIMDYDKETIASCLKVITDFSTWSLRQLANECDYEFISVNATSKVISFRKSFSRSNQPDSFRINIYYTTGTVGTCLDHSSQGKTQSFRRCVTLKEVREIFKNPRILFWKGYELAANDTNVGIKSSKRDLDDYRYNNKRIKVERSSYSTSSADIVENKSEKEALNEEMKRLGILKAEIEARQVEVKNFLRDIESKEKAEKQRQAQVSVLKKQEEKQKIEQRRLERRGANFKIFCADQPFVEEILQEKTNLFGFSEKSVLSTFDHGGVAFGGGMHIEISKLLRTRKPSHPQPTIIALCPADYNRYFIRFSNGKTYWSALLDSEVDMDRYSSEIGAICFGFTPQKGPSYYIKVKGAYFMKNLPRKFEEFIENNVVQKASLGDNGEWFIQTKGNINVFGGNVSRQFRQDWTSIKPCNIKNVKFGANHTHIIRY